jgi:hypothetical protein
MIRRDIDLGDGRALWLLVSQVEHARLSAVLAERCLDRFGPVTAEIDSVRSELLQAIARHDDGWADWEARPGLDPQLGRPLSFRELPLDETLANWDGSIRSAAEVGPLAAWAVAGHFAGLLRSSKSDFDQAVLSAWLSKIAQQRDAWLATWQQQDPALHSQQLADEALQWVRAFDAMSLWICSVCPFGGVEVLQWSEGYHIGPGESLDIRLAADSTADISERGVVTVDPWRFDAPQLEIEASGYVVPVREYQNTDELLAVYEPIQLRWRLCPLTS